MVLWCTSFRTSAIPRYTALAPQMIPTMPVNVLNVMEPDMTGFLVISRIANIKNNMNKLPNTNCSARLAFNVPKNMPKVKIPHIMKYAAKEDADGAKPVE